VSTSRPAVDAIIRGLQTKSDKIRALARVGYPTAEIARLLGLRYQHVYNVLDASGERPTRLERDGAEPSRKRPPPN
jgi:hypothetical protein